MSTSIETNEERQSETAGRVGDACCSNTGIPHSNEGLLSLLLKEQQQLTAVEEFSQQHSEGRLPNQAKYYQKLMPTSPPGVGEQYAFEVNLDACSGCKACVVACIFLGHDADWLYAIAFGEPYLRGDIWVVPYELNELVLELAGPFKASGQYAMQVFAKKKGAGMKLEARGPAFKAAMPGSKALAPDLPAVAQPR